MPGRPGGADGGGGDHDGERPQIHEGVDYVKGESIELKQLKHENAALKKQVEALLKDKAKNLKTELKAEISEINGVSFLAKKVDLDAGGIKDLAFQLGDEFENLFLLFGTEQNGKALLSCYISKELAKEKDLHAGKIVKDLGKYIQGGGGGQPFFATAGGKKPEGINEALQEAQAYLK